MDRRRLLTIGFVALALGVLVSRSVYRTLESRVVVPTKPSVNVVVAARDLQVGTRIEDSDIKVAKIQTEDVGDLPHNLFRHKSDVVGRGVITPIEKGDFISPKKLAGERDLGLTSLIPPGMRAFPVRANDIVSVAGFVTAGSRVDVLLTGDSAGGKRTTTVLENASVLAADQRLEHESASKSQPSVITLLVSLEDAQRLALASSEGHIQLILRNPVDNKQENPRSLPLEMLYRLSPAPRPKMKQVSTPQAEPPSYWLIKGDKMEKKTF
jgi:pilus assembly protein CpaB